MTISLEGITLPDDLEWVDEFDWSPVRQRQEVALSGKLVVEEATQDKGRPITLVGGENAAWVNRSTVEALHTLAQAAGTTRTLDYHGRIFTVLFRQRDKPVDARQILRLANPGAGHKYSITLRLMEVA